VPLGIALVIKLIPPGVMAEHRALATAAQDRPVSKTAAGIIIAIWVAAIGLTAWFAYHYFMG
jgi:hypothetical protein